jgi:hypothetical protein
MDPALAFTSAQPITVRCDVTSWRKMSVMGVMGSEYSVSGVALIPRRGLVAQLE